MGYSKNAVGWAMLLLACCGTTVGCTGTAGHSRTSSGTGTISGTVVSVGGPYPGSMAEIAAEVTGSGTSRFSVRSSATDGFSLSVPAGDYAVNAHLAGPCTAAQVSVPPGGTGTARIVCQVK